MCTALSFKAQAHFFGRNLDLDYGYDEAICILPRQRPLPFRHAPTLEAHYALIGMAYVQDDYPLFYDACNEHGLAMAGLNFPGTAFYPPFETASTAAHHIAPFEFIPWVLSQFASVSELRPVLQTLCLVDTPFSEHLPNAPLHWLIADAEASLVVESCADGLHVYDNPTGVLTNNPRFDIQQFQLQNYRHLSACESAPQFSQTLPFETYSLGLGGLGLPGDLSSMSRFVRACFYSQNSQGDVGELEAVHQFFHLLESVYQIKGANFVADTGRYEYTRYTACMDTARGRYYYKTYYDTALRGVDLHHVDLESRDLFHYPLQVDPQVEWAN